MGPGYNFKGQSAAEFAPWATENVFVPSFPYSPEAQLDDALTSDYPPLGGGQADWSNFTGLSQPPVSAPLATVPFFSGDALVSPTGWTLETDSDSCEFSPIDICRPTAEVDTSPNPGWSWSQPSSPSVEIESLPSPPATLVEYKTAATVRAAKTKPTPKLRTASRPTRKSSRKSTRTSAASPSEVESNTPDEQATPEEQRARRNHNLVEKQYRNRLNAQFERLLSVLPTDQQRRPGRSGDEDGSGGSDDKRMSKAEVLDCATRRIKELESERHYLQQERKELLKSMELMNGAIPRVTPR